MNLLKLDADHEIVLYGVAVGRPRTARGGLSRKEHAVAPPYREILAEVEKLTGAKALAAGIEPGVPQTGPGTVGRPRLAPAKRSESRPIRCWCGRPKG